MLFPHLISISTKHLIRPKIGHARILCLNHELHVRLLAEIYFPELVVLKVVYIERDFNKWEDKGNTISWNELNM